MRVILRNLGGKFCWDSAVLYSAKEDAMVPRAPQLPLSSRKFQRDEQLLTSSFIGGDGAIIQPSPPRLSVRHRPSNTMPKWEDTADDMDNLEDV